MGGWAPGAACACLARVDPVVVNLKICCALGDVSHTSLTAAFSGDKTPRKKLHSRRLFQVQTTLEPAAARAISRRTRFEGEASADEAYSPGSGAVQVSGRWKCAIWCPATRPVRKTHKPGREIRTAMIHLAVLAVRSPLLAFSELRTAKTVIWIISVVLALTSPGPLRPPADDLPPR